MPEHQKFLTLIEDRTEKAKQIAEVERNIAEFEISGQRSSARMRAESRPAWSSRPCRSSQPRDADRPGPDLELRPGDRPGLPARARRPLGEGARARDPRPDVAAPGSGPADPADRPDASGRPSLDPGTPDSIEADAYRNVRASLLGVADKRGPIVTLLVTSAKAGEGKSTTALNLAATCAGPASGPCSWTSTSAGPAWPSVFIER